MNSRHLLLLASAVTLAAVSACSSSGSGAAGGSSPRSGAVAGAGGGAGGGAQTISLKSGHLVASNGRSLYILTSDQPGAPACSGACLTNWPPIIGKGTPGTGVRDDFATIARGSDTQVTFDQHPLYMFIGDTKAGDTNGNGIKAFGGTWLLATSATGSSDAASPSTSAKGGGYGYP